MATKKYCVYWKYREDVEVHKSHFTAPVYTEGQTKHQYEFFGSLEKAKDFFGDNKKDPPCQDSIYILLWECRGPALFDAEKGLTKSKNCVEVDEHFGERYYRTSSW